MASIQPYNISVPDEALKTLQTKLSLTTFPNQVNFSDDWAYGAPLSDVKRLVERWNNGFDWRAQEKRLNESLPQFTTRVSVKGFDDLDIHFVHQKAKRPDSIPLLFVHGCKFLSDYRYERSSFLMGNQGQEVSSRLRRYSPCSPTRKMTVLHSTSWRHLCPTTGFLMRS